MRVNVRYPVTLILIITVTALSIWEMAFAADPTCSQGLCSKLACCPSACGRCGGDGCLSRPLGSQCCQKYVLTRNRPCQLYDPPCTLNSTSDCAGDNFVQILTRSTVTMETTMPSPPTSASSSSSQSPSPISLPSASGMFLTGQWQNITAELDGLPLARHEACFLMAQGKGYLIGGRGKKNVGIFDPKVGTWTNGVNMPTQMHHMQCVHYNGTIYVPTSWYGGSPNESINEYMWAYDIGSDSWRNLTGLPLHRRRGAAASVILQNKIWVIAGNIGGHGPPSITLGYLDYFDLESGEWITELPDLPEGRDHVGAAVVGGKICIAGGRDGGIDKYKATIASTFCYDVGLSQWQNMNAPIPHPRAGAATGLTCDGKMMVVGGEGPPKRVFEDVEVFNGTGWEIWPPLVRARHGTGIAIANCNCGHIYIAAGSGDRGGRPELSSTERFIPLGGSATCSEY